MLVACALLLAACQDKSGPDYNVGPALVDAHVFKDAHQDPPKVYKDAPPIMRSCTNMTPDFTDAGATENIVLEIVCESPADALDADFKFTYGTDVMHIQRSVACATMAGGPAYNTFHFAVTPGQNFRATVITTTPYLLDCN